MDHNLDNIQLPKDSRNIQLETISKNFFRPLFNPEKFVLKEETIDNGIDFRIELKKNGNILGFGLNFQLKSSESIKRNKDGSYSKSIETSNIEYLLNNAQPAFYGFYVLDENIFYYEDLKSYISNLNSQEINWQEQLNHTIKFTKKLTKDAIIEVYNVAFNTGIMLRKIHSAFAESFIYGTDNEKIIIDKQGDVKTDSEIINFIEEYGLFLNDECRWDEIIQIHEKSSIAPKKSPKYSFIIGMAYFYTGDYFKSLNSLKEAHNQINILEPTLKEYLIFSYTQLRKLYGIINESECNEIIQNIKTDGNINYYIELEKIQKLMFEVNQSSDFISKDFECKINSFINNSKIDKKIILLAKIELVKYHSKQLVNKLGNLLITDNFNIIQKLYNEVNQEFHMLLLETQDVKNRFINHYCSLTHSKFIIHFDSIYKIRFNVSHNQEVMNKILTNIQNSIEYFKAIQHIENQLFSLSILLEYYQNIDNQERINETIVMIEQYKIYDNPELNKKIDFIKEGGTLTAQLLIRKKKIEEENVQIEKMRVELSELDKMERDVKIDNSNCYTIELFPIGHFFVPKNKMDKCFEILGITGKEKLKNQLIEMFNIVVVPVINIYALDLEIEGYMNGIYECKGIENYKNMYRIRKEFHENKFYRKN